MGIKGRRRGAMRGRWPLLVVALVVAVAAVVLVNWPRLASGLAGPPPVGNTLLVSSATEIAEARSALGRLTLVVRPESARDYRRAAFGDAWTDTDRNGCNQRDDVLLRDVVKSAPYQVARQRDCDHDVLAGTWIDPYTGATITLTDAKQPRQAESVQIDHIVPLSVAWRYGANAWSDAERLRFANDLRNLAAVGGGANQAKGGSDAAEWQPIQPARCGYAVRYVAVKSAYSLPTDERESSALADMLATCP